MSDKVKAMITGGVFVIALIVAYIVGYGIARGDINAQCEEYRAFTYDQRAWGCVPLRKGVRNVGKDEIIYNGEVKS